ncbi:MAG: RNA polymerase subunit sigma, partial [Betaproteobacteria bacterium]|nr:RNA polymerase subunit sigma [Betaproteobacteria bacterium]
RDDRAAKGWLYTILRNEHARLHERKQLAIDPDRELDELMDSSGANAFNAFEMRDMLAALPETYREPLMLQVIGGFGCAEIARMIGITEGAVMTRLTRARQAVRKLIDPKLLARAKELQKM